MLKVSCFFKSLSPDPVEFNATSDCKSNKPIAVRVRSLPAGSVEIDTLGEKPVTGVVQSEARPNLSGLAADQSLGTVSYERNGVCYVPPNCQSIEIEI